MTRSILLVLLVAAGSLPAQDAPVLPPQVYAVQALADVEIEGSLPAMLTGGVGFLGGRAVPLRRHYAVLDGSGQVYLTEEAGEDGERVFGPSGPPRTFRLALAVSQPRDVSGTLFLEEDPFEDTGMVAVPFRVPATEFSPDGREGFLETKAAHYADLLTEGGPGAGWFRHMLRETREQLGQESDADVARRNARGRARSGDSLEDTFNLFTGGRAVSENLQLDRTLPLASAGERSVALDSLAGVTTAAYDWAPLVEGLAPDLDPLAALVPADQHAVFFPSFEAMVGMSDEADRQGTPVLAALETRSEDASTRARYETQLGLPMSAIARLLGPHLIASVAMTGGDPYLRTGSDVAILFEAKDLDALQTLVTTRIGLAAAAVPDAESVQGSLDGVPYSGRRSPDRRMCSYVASLGNAVIVTNSLAQLGRLGATARGEVPDLASLEEYVYFRDRYRRGDPGESAFVMLSDATIRRWCGPRWRIGTSRRTQAAAVLAEVQAASMRELVGGAVEPRALLPSPDLPDLGALDLGARGVRSDVWGTLDFQTPVAELQLDMVTEEEAGLYQAWRDGYQRNWSNFFDPIAVRFRIEAGLAAVDLSVRPLIANSDYREFVAFSQGASVDPHDGDPHEGTLLHWAMALDKQSRSLVSGVALLKAMAPSLDPLAWMGDTIAAYAEDDPYWDELAQAEEPDDFLLANFHRFPVALHVEVESGMRLVAFLTGLRAFAEQAAPGMTVWENFTHGEAQYVRVSPSEMAKADADELENLALFYAASGEGLVVSLSEELVQRAMDRMAARRAARTERRDAEPSAPPWLGEHMVLRADGHVTQILETALQRQGEQPLQRPSWSNLAILNEWKRLFPERDPVEVHEQVWGRRLLCPGGGSYRWNPEWHTMESSAYGHPGQPQDGPVLAPSIRRLLQADFGVTFEEDGLRARVELQQED